MATSKYWLCVSLRQPVNYSPQTCTLRAEDFLGIPDICITFPLMSLWRIHEKYCFVFFVVFFNMEGLAHIGHVNATALFSPQDFSN